MSGHHSHLNSHRWAAVRRAVFKRDGYRCVVCGRAGRLECDHITPLEREPGQNPLKVNGLQSVCRQCHIEKTARENRNRRPLTPEEAEWRRAVMELMNRRDP